VTTEKDAEKEEVKNPPKVRLNEFFVLVVKLMCLNQVLFEDQHGHRVAHNPGTLEHK
jgi:hypothetical protein